MTNKINLLYTQILVAAGGAGNISSIGSCMTRLRFTLKDESSINIQNFKTIPGVLGYIKTASSTS